nr:hypothetical protein [uncultured Chryseobacterium sp.]
MEFIKKSYYYFFYKVYKSIEYTSDLSGGKFFSAFKTSLVMIVLELFLLASILIYYKLFINFNANIIGTEKQWIIMVILLVLIDYIMFYKKNQWKNIVSEFDNLPTKKNKLGSWIVFLIIISIITNFILSFILYYRM